MDDMEIFLMMGVFWTIYGIAGLFGFQMVPPPFRGKSWTKEYARAQGIGWIVMGIPWVVVTIIDRYYYDFSFPIAIILILLVSAPGMIYSIHVDKKYKKKLYDSIP